MFDSVSSQIVAPQNTNNLCYENALFSSPKYRIIAQSQMLTRQN